MRLPIQGELEHLIVTHEEYTLDDFVFPFTEEIREMALPKNFKILAIQPYEEKTNPLEHVSVFNDHMNLIAMTGPTYYKGFSMTLAKAAKKWFWKLPSGLISSWAHLSKELNQQFQSIRTYATLCTSLLLSSRDLGSH